jgi:hypothetical protein
MDQNGSKIFGYMYIYVFLLAATHGDLHIPTYNMYNKKIIENEILSTSYDTH